MKVWQELTPKEKTQVISLNCEKIANHLITPFTPKENATEMKKPAFIENFLKANIYKINDDLTINL
jgi:tRNA 2-selenouridine synthase SelU